MPSSLSPHSRWVADSVWVDPTVTEPTVTTDANGASIIAFPTYLGAYREIRKRGVTREDARWQLRYSQGLVRTGH